MDTVDKPEVTTVKQWSALGLAWQLGYAIAVPIAVFALAGRLLDRTLGTSPLFLIAGTILAVIASSVWVTRKALQIQRDLTEKK